MYVLKKTRAIDKIGNQNKFECLWEGNPKFLVEQTF